MFDFDSGLDSLELGSRRRPVKWAVELSLADCRPQKHKARRRQQAAQQAANQHQQQDGEHQQMQQTHAQLQQQAQQQRAAAHRQHLEHLVQIQQLDPAYVTPAQAKYRKEFRDASVVCLSTEIEQGNVEYKYRLTACNNNENRRHQLVTQMKFRLSEGSGECFYYLGVEDDGYPRGLEPQELQDSIAVIHRMAVSLQATARLVEYVPGGFGRTAALMHIKANAEEDMRLTDSRVAVAGSMDSAKSTLVAVLTHGADGRPLLDNGRGSARMAVFRHKHEIESGRTSSISQQVLGYDDEGRVLNYVGVATPTPADITAAATHMVNFIDMGGHEKYLKTTLYGMTCLLPDYALLCVDAATGINRITREHLAVAVALEVPTALVVTKADAVDEAQLQQVLEQLHTLMQPVLQHCQPRQQRQQQGGSAHSGSPAGRAGEAQAEGLPEAGCSSSGGSGSSSGGVPVVQTEQQAVALAAGLSELHSCTAAPAAPSFQQAVFPVFVVSCVTGAGVPLLHAFLAHLRPLQQLKQAGGCAASASTSAAAGDSGPQVLQEGWADASPAAASIAPAGQLHQQQLRSLQQAAAAVVGKPCCRDGSSQLWGVSPKKPAPPVAAGVTTGAHAPSSPPEAAATVGAVQLQTACSPCPPAAGAASEQQEEEEVEEACAGHFQVVHTYDVEGVGWVVSGIAVTGTIEVGQSLLWGPTPEGGFSPVRVTCIQRSHIPVRQIAPGQTATLALQTTSPGLPHSGSRQALLTAAAVAQSAAAEAAAREAAAAIAAVPDPIAKTRRRSPAALQAAAVAAASTAATAAAAVEAARRAAQTVDGRAWWAQQQAATCAAAAAAGDGDRDGISRQGSAAAEGAVRGGSIGDLLDDDFAAGLGADTHSGSDSGADLFGGDDDPLQPQRSGSSTACTGAVSRRGAAGAAPTAVAAAAGRGPACQVGSAAADADDDGEDVFGGLLADVFAAEGDDDGEDEQQLSPVRRSSSSSSSAGGLTSGSSSGLSQSWSFSSTASSSGRRDGAAQRVRSTPAVMQQSARAAVSFTTGGVVRSLSTVQQQQQGGGSEQLLGCSPSRWRNKGGVLLGAAAAPHTHWEFEALLVLLGGFWPPRGLLSGSWPPEEDAQPAAAAAAGGECVGGTQAAARGEAGCPGSSAHQQEQGQQQQPSEALGRKQRRGSKRYEFAYVVHCNSIRQIAQVVSMQELRGHGPEEQGAGVDAGVAFSSTTTSSSSTCSGKGAATGADPSQQQASNQQQQQREQQQLRQQCGLTVSIRAAAALLQGDSAPASDRGEPSSSGSGSASGDSSGDASRRQRQRRLGSSTTAAAAAAGSGCGGNGAGSGSKGVRRQASDAGSVVRVRLRFTHRPEWMQVGARLIVRDRSDGHVAAAGFVTKLLAPHTQLQQHQREQQQGRGGKV